jgi:hypothetical protein
MLHLRIYLKVENGIRWFIPAPLWLLKACVGMGEFGMRIAKNRIPEEQLAYVENIDFRELKRALDVLKAYKGLHLVDVKAKDGTEVRIIV